MKIALLHLKQDQEYSCLPACIRIVLHYLGSDFSETTIGNVCQTAPIGTDRDDAAQGIALLGFKTIKLIGATNDDITRFIQSGHPVIVLLSVNELPYGGQAGMHAVVVNNYGTNEISFIDPARGEEITLTLSTFLKAWRARGCRGLIIYR